MNGPQPLQNSSNRTPKTFRRSPGSVSTGPSPNGTSCSVCVTPGQQPPPKPQPNIVQSYHISEQAGVARKVLNRNYLVGGNNDSGKQKTSSPHHYPDYNHLKEPNFNTSSFSSTSSCQTHPGSLGHLDKFYSLDMQANKWQNSPSRDDQNVGPTKTPLTRTEGWCEACGRSGGVQSGEGKTRDKGNSSHTSTVFLKSNSWSHEVTELVGLIFDERLYVKSLQSSGIDTEQLPLGKIDMNLIEKAADCLQLLETAIARKMQISENPEFTQALTTYQPRRKLPMCDSVRLDDYIKRKTLEFFQYVPLWRKKSEPVDTFLQIKKKTDLLGEMEGIYVSLGLLHTVTHKEQLVSLFSGRLRSLAGDASNVVAKALAATHAFSHQTYKMTARAIFDCTDVAEVERHYKEAFHCSKNRMLLWHGSPLAKWPEILTRGFKMDPENRPQSAYMFDKGIYFTDMSSASANRCKLSRTCQYGLLALAEVALGVPYKRLEADYNARHASAKSCGHTWGVGRYQPPEEGKVIMESAISGLKVYFNTAPAEPDRSVWDKACRNWSAWTSANYPADLPPPSWENSPLLYNEYVVYNPAQIILRYLLIVKYHPGK